jgi:hypothetical protein
VYARDSIDQTPSGARSVLPDNTGATAQRMTDRGKPMIATLVAVLVSLLAPVARGHAGSGVR